MLIFLFAFASYLCSAQVTDVEHIGQTPGGAGYNVNWDSTGQKLIVGCGTSIWIYDCTDTSDYHVVAKRPLLGLINETDLYGDVLFAAVTHDGVWALDYNSSQLQTLAHYQIENDAGAYDMWRTNDTLYIATQNNIIVLKYSTYSGFTKIDQFGGPGDFCVSRRGDYLAVGTKGLFNGTVSIFHYSNLTNPVAIWQSNLVCFLQDIQFADLNDDIIYLCGGPANLLATKSYFFALHFDGNTLTALDNFLVDGGIPLFAAMNIQNMDSRNDTVFVATGAAYNTTTIPLTYMPILDCSGLPNSGIDSIGYVIPGLWHFDAALMDGTVYIAMSSEWLGVLISDISELNPSDTLELLETGGWCVNSQIFGDTLWACHEGFGIVAYKLDSLYYTAGTMTDSRLMHYFTQFVSDFDILGDTLLILSTSEILNLSPWLHGGEPVFERSMNLAWITSLKFMETNMGTRLVTGYSPLGLVELMMLFDPFDSIAGYPPIFIDTVDNNVMSMQVMHDTLYCGKKFGTDYYLAAYKVINDEFVLIDTIKAPGEISGISVDGNKTAVSCMTMGFAWYSFNGYTFTQIGEYDDWFIVAIDIKLKNNLAYVANRPQGMKIFDVSQSIAVEVATGTGTMGWTNMFGSTAIDIGPNGQIFLSDFNSGVIIFETYDSTLTSVKQDIKIEKQQIFLVYPNPAKNELFIDCTENNVSEVNVVVFDLSGRQVQRFIDLNKGKQGKIKLDLNDLPDGVYILKIQTATNSESHIIEVIR